MSLTRDQIRAALLGAPKQFKRELVKVQHPAGEIEVEVRAPSVKSRGAILRAAKALAGDANSVEMEHMQVEAVLRCCFEPGTDRRIFEEADRESLLGLPTGCWFDELAGVATSLLNVSADEKKELEKNSEGTPSA